MRGKKFREVVQALNILRGEIQRQAEKPPVGTAWCRVFRKTEQIVDRNAEIAGDLDFDRIRRFAFVTLIGRNRMFVDFEDDFLFVSLTQKKLSKKSKKLKKNY